MDIESIINKIVKIETKDGKILEGIVLPRPKLYDKNYITLKLNNGYNIGIHVNSIKSLKILGEVKKTFEKNKYVIKKQLPWVSIIGTGGTIASKVDYKTGGVISQYKPEDLIKKFPFILDLVNIKSKVAFSYYSEEFDKDLYIKLAKEIYKELEDKGLEGIIIMHGTDTMHYTSSIISFMIQNNPIPIIFTGAQRSSDRPSSDAYFNLLSSILVATKTNVADVGICMHGSINDDFSYYIRGVRARKMHSTRRDAFKAVNDKPILKIYYKDKRIEKVGKVLLEKDKNRVPILYEKLEDKIALIYYYPNFDLEILEYFIDKNYKAIILMGTGMGHISVVRRNSIEILKRAYKQGTYVFMTTQTIYGTTNPRVYFTGRILEKEGKVIYLEDMLPEVAYTKAMWAFGNFEDEKAIKLMKKNLRGEISERRDI